MGCYFYKVTAQKIKLSDGTFANKAVYAYKPFGGWHNDEENERMYRRSGCTRAENYVKKPSFTGKVYLNGKVAKVKIGVFSDDWFAELQPLEGVTVAE